MKKVFRTFIDSSILTDDEAKLGYHSNNKIVWKIEKLVKKVEKFYFNHGFSCIRNEKSFYQICFINENCYENFLNLHGYTVNY